MNLDNMFKLIKTRGLTAAQVSADTGISASVLSDWKNGKSIPTVTKLELVADYLGCSVDYLIGREKSYSMKLPKGTGTVYKLSGNRRKPYIVRKAIGWELDKKSEKVKQRYKTVGYAATREEGLEMLRKYNESLKDNDKN